MADEPVLSPDEVDALTDREQDEKPPPTPDEVRSYDLANQDRIVRGRLPTLELVNERFARRFRTRLTEMLRRPVDASQTGIEVKKFEEYVSALALPCSASLIQMSPLRGHAAITMTPELVFSTIDFFFGGSGGTVEGYEEHEFTSTELGILKMVNDEVISAWQRAWEVVLPLQVEHVKTESNPRFASIANPNEPVLDCVFEIEIEAQTAELHIAIPYAMVEPIRDQLELGVQGDRNEIDDRWLQTLRVELVQAKVDLRIVLATAQVRLAQLMRLKAGDILPVSMEEPVPVSCGGVKLFHGRFGVHEKNYAVKLVERCGNQSQSPLNRVDDPRPALETPEADAQPTSQVS